MKKIMVDIDGVIADFHTPFLDYVNDRLGGCYTFDDWKGKRLVGMSKDELDKYHKDFVKSNGYKDIRMIPNARKGVQHLSQLRDIVFCTARPVELAYDTIKWLQKRNMDYPTYFEKSKIWFCKGRGIDEMVEDEERMLNFATQCGMSCYGILRPYNQDIRKNEKVVVCNGIGAVAEFIESTL